VIANEITNYFVLWISL